MLNQMTQIVVLNDIHCGAGYLTAREKPYSVTEAVAAAVVASGSGRYHLEGGGENVTPGKFETKPLPVPPDKETKPNPPDVPERKDEPSSSSDPVQASTRAKSKKRRAVGSTSSRSTQASGSSAKSRAKTASDSTPATGNGGKSTRS